MRLRRAASDCGVGKTVLAAAYAERARRTEYRAMCGIRAETLDTMWADLVLLGVRLGWGRRWPEGGACA